MRWPGLDTYLFYFFFRLQYNYANGYYPRYGYGSRFTKRSVLQSSVHSVPQTTAVHRSSSQSLSVHNSLLCPPARPQITITVRPARSAGGSCHTVHQGGATVPALPLTARAGCSRATEAGARSSGAPRFPPGDGHLQPEFEFGIATRGATSALCKRTDLSQRPSYRARTGPLDKPATSCQRRTHHSSSTS